jgi:hypothetical protein
MNTKPSSCLRAIMPLAFFPLALAAQDNLDYRWNANPVYNGEPQSIVERLSVNNVDLTDNLVETYVDLATNITLSGRPTNAGQYKANVVFPGSVGIKDINQTFTIHPFEVNTLLNPVAVEYGQVPEADASHINFLSGPGISKLPTDWVTLKQTWINTLVVDQSQFNFGAVNENSPVGTNGSYDVDVLALNTNNGPNYHFNPAQQGAISVTKATITVSANAVTHYYRDTTPVTTSYSYSPFKNGESAAVLIGEPNVVIAGVNTASAVPGTYDGAVVVSRGNLVADNYVFEFVNADLTILKANQDLSFLPSSLDLNFRDADYQLLTNVQGSGLPIEWSSPSGSSVTLNNDNTLTVVAKGDTTLVAKQAGDDFYNPAGPYTVTVKVDVAEFDMDSLFPFYNDMTFQPGKTVDLADPANYEGIPSGYEDLFADSTTVNNTFDFQILWGAGSEAIVSSVSGSQVTLANPGPIVILVNLIDPNFVPGKQSYRTIEFRKTPVANPSTPVNPGGAGEKPAYDPDATVTIPTVPGDEPELAISDVPIAEGTSLGEDWYQLDWLGIYYWDQDGLYPNHIWTERYGWLYVPDPYLVENPVWMFSYLKETSSGKELGWIFSQAKPVSGQDPTDRYFARPNSTSGTTEWIWFSEHEQDTKLRVFYDFDGETFLLTHGQQ